MAEENNDKMVEEKKEEEKKEEEKEEKKEEEKKEEEKEEKKEEEKKEEEKKEEKKEIVVLGVDFGTNASVVSKTVTGSTKLPVIVQNRISNASTPFAFSFLFFFFFEEKKKLDFSELTTHPTKSTQIQPNTQKIRSWFPRKPKIIWRRLLHKRPRKHCEQPQTPPWRKI